MLGRVDEDAIRDEPAGDAPDEPAVVRDVMDGERAHDEVEATGPERRLLDRLAHVRQARMAPLGPGQLEHPLGEVELARAERRSEEHTSELQSLAYLVCRLLLEKKKN